MKKSNTSPQKYNRTVIVIHWVSVFLILILFPLGKYMAGLEAEEKGWLIKLHGILGILIFTLTMVRSVLFFTKQRPTHLNTGSKFNDLLAIGVQRSFYILLLVIGVSGIVTLVVGGYGEMIMSSPELPELILPRSEITSLKIHNILAVIMMILIVVHVVGVIRFNLKNKLNVLKRIS
jgi:cytochrome b561